MSLMSVREKLNNAALEDGASKEDLLRAALAASNDRYEKAVQEQNARLDRLEAAVRASNEQRAIDVQGALKNAAEAILGDVRTESAAYIKAIEEARRRNGVDVPAPERNEMPCCQAGRGLHAVGGRAVAVRKRRTREAAGSDIGKAACCGR